MTMTEPSSASPPARPFLEMRGVSKRLGHQQVLDDAHLAVRRGETLVVLGRSGEGKSVLLKHLAGLMTPDAGSIKIDGEEIVGVPERRLGPMRRKLGLLFQNGALFDSFDVEENVAFPLMEQGGHDFATLRYKAHEALAAVGMEEHATKMPVQLSGGQRKRVALARAIVTRPQCLLYDEPTAGLDPIATANIDRLIRAFQTRFQVTSLVITHELKSVDRIADRVAFLSGGKIHFLGTPEELWASPDPLLRQFLAGEADASESMPTPTSASSPSTEG